MISDSASHGERGRSKRNLSSTPYSERIPETTRKSTTAKVDNHHSEEKCDAAKTQANSHLRNPAIHTNSESNEIDETRVAKSVVKPFNNVVDVSVKVNEPASCENRKSIPFMESSMLNGDTPTASKDDDDEVYDNYSDDDFED